MPKNTILGGKHVGTRSGTSNTSVSSRSGPRLTCFHLHIVSIPLGFHVTQGMDIGTAAMIIEAFILVMAVPIRYGDTYTWKGYIMEDRITRYGNVCSGSYVISGILMMYPPSTTNQPMIHDLLVGWYPWVYIFPLKVYSEPKDS